MPNTWFASDHHFSHEACITKFKRSDGSPLRDFANVDEMNETIIKRHNQLVHDKDRVYIMGDVAMNKKYLYLVSRLAGRKVLLKGNHDIFKLSDYTPYFDDIRSYKIYPAHGLIVSHIPVHPCQLEHRFKLNLCGHTHANFVPNQYHPSKPDGRYINACMETNNYTPLSLEEVLEKGSVV